MRTAVLTLLVLVTVALNGATVNQQYTLTIDPQALAIAQASLTAMGGVQALASYQDSLASGTVTVYSGGASVSYPITMKSKGLRETRVELQKTNGMNIRIVNQGQGVILRNGAVQTLDSNNTFYEHIHQPRGLIYKK